MAVIALGTPWLFLHVFVPTLVKNMNAGIQRAIYHPSEQTAPVAQGYATQPRALPLTTPANSRFVAPVAARTAAAPSILEHPDLPWPKQGAVRWYSGIQAPSWADGGHVTVDTPMMLKGGIVLHLVDWNTNQPVVDLFIAAFHMKTLIALPLGKYRVYELTGPYWYGAQRMFGPLGETWVSNVPLVIDREGPAIMGATINLNPHAGGDMPFQQVANITH